MKEEGTRSRPLFPRWTRRILALTTVLGLLTGSVLLTQNSLLTWAANWALKASGMPVQIERVSWDWSGHHLTLVRPSWRDASQSLSLDADTLFLRNVKWSTDSLYVAELHLVSPRIEGRFPLDTANTRPSTPWKEKWPTSLAFATIGSVHWETIDVKQDSTAQLQIHAGRLEGLLFSSKGITLPYAELSGAEMTTSSLPQPVKVTSSELSAEWSDSAWSVQSQGLHLPGLHFQGSMAWPRMKGHGEVEIQWPELQPWLTAWGSSSLLSDWNLTQAQTKVSWDLDSTHWHVHMHGPKWLSLTSMGGDSRWGLDARLSEVPGALQRWIPSPRLALQARGDVASFNWTLQGEDSLDVNGDVHSELSLREAIFQRHLDGEIQATVSAWPGWVESAEEVLEAHLQSSEGSIRMVVLQDLAEVPWSARAHLNGSRLEISGSATRLPLAPEHFVALETWGSIDFSQDWNEANWDVDVAIEGDTLSSRGQIHDLTGPVSWLAHVRGAGVQGHVESGDSPTSWNHLLTRVAQRKTTRWPQLSADLTLAPDNAVTKHVLRDITLNDTAVFHVKSTPRDFEAHVFLNQWEAGGLALDSTVLTLKGQGSALFANLSMETPEPRPAGLPAMLSIDVHADTAWFANLAFESGTGEVAEWAFEGSPGPTALSPWNWVAHRGEIPLGFDRLVLAETPLRWSAPLRAPLPSFWKLKGEKGDWVFQAQLPSRGTQSVSFYGGIRDAQDLGVRLDPQLQINRLNSSGRVTWVPGTDNLKAVLDVGFEEVGFREMAFPDASAEVTWQRGMLTAEAKATNPALGCELTCQGSLHPLTLSTPGLQADISGLPLEWFQPWIDSSAARIQGSLHAQLNVRGPLDAPQVQGTGSLQELEAFVPSLGTAFGGSGGMTIEPDGVFLQGFELSDVNGTTTRVEGALLHDDFRDWNLDVAIVDAQENLTIMNLPAKPGSPVYGTLHGRGSVDVFFWNDRITIEGDVVADAPTSFFISLVTDSEDGWDELVHFTQPERAALDVASEPTEDLSVVLDLNIEALPEAEVTIVTDEENNANIVGHTEGNIHFVLEDWERMTLNGELDVIEGQYDFALGPFLRKTFVARPGGTLFWGGDPYAGTLNLDAVYTTRANVAPLIGSSTSGPRNETIDVILHLSGSMLKPNISFDLEAPKADRLVAEALASSLADENDKTNQAIALLSLQEFLPSTFNTLELGANGLQEYSIDMITSQVSRWLSRINEDIEVGISYDAQNSFNPSLTDNQDALQLALKASFLEDKLEVEGSLGSRAITQEALGEARLQNIRVIYHLNEEKGIDLTGYSESQTSATQSANSTSQGVGIRWHRSFDWTWPWLQKETED